MVLSACSVLVSTLSSGNGRSLLLIRLAATIRVIYREAVKCKDRRMGKRERYVRALVATTKILETAVGVTNADGMQTASTTTKA